MRARFWNAVHTLATSPQPIQKRLFTAGLTLLVLSPEEFPPKLRMEFLALRQQLTREEAARDEGTLEATTRQLTDEEASQLAEKIFHIYTALHGGIHGIEEH